MITTMRYLMELLDDTGRRHLRTMLLAQAVQGILQGLGVLFVVPLLSAIASTPADWPRFWSWTAAIALVVAVHHGLLAWSTSLGYVVGTDVLTSFHERIGNHLATLPIGWFSGDRAGPVSRLLSKGTMDIANIPAHLARHVIVGLTAPMTIVVGSFVFDWQVGLALTVGGSLCAACLVLLMAIVHRNDEAYDSDIGESASRIVEYARQQPTLRAYGVLDRPGLGRLEESLNRQQRSQSRLTTRGAGGMIAFFGTLQLVVTAVVALIVWQAQNGAVAGPAVLGLFIVTLRMLDPISQLGELAGHVQVNADAVRRVRSLLTQPRLPEPAVPVTPAGVGIHLDDIHFSYPGGDPVIRGITARIAPGSLTAIVGPSGSGKSTLLKLISRFFDVDSGAVRIGGYDVRDIGSIRVAKLVAPVFQEVYLFEGTISDNVRMADPAATDADLGRVAALARLDEVVVRLPDGWDARVGEGGSTLSGGESQRVSIARALLKRAPIVLLDEATAALDPANEAAVADALRELARDRTVVVVAHRLSTVAAADQILVLDRGRITERGDHASLLAAGGTHERFWNERVRARGWQLTRS
jgi:ATP-binding cassette, subfamily B, bacterial IrtB/YbtQ